MKLYRLIILSSLVSSISACAGGYSNCGNWKITGYYTPLEQDFGIANTKMITLTNQQQYSFSQPFLDTVRMEGWGKTRDGWYLGYYDSHWHRSSFPKDSRGRALTVGAAATKSTTLNYGAKIHIPSLSNYLQQAHYTVTDTGGGLGRRQIDIYTGEGVSARLTSYKVTGHHHVCVL